MRSCVREQMKTVPSQHRLKLKWKERQTGLTLPVRGETKMRWRCGRMWVDHSCLSNMIANLQLANKLAVWQPKLPVQAPDTLINILYIKQLIYIINVLLSLVRISSMITTTIACLETNFFFIFFHNINSFFDHPKLAVSFLHYVISYSIKEDLSNHIYYMQTPYQFIFLWKVLSWYREWLYISSHCFSHLWRPITYTIWLKQSLKW